MLNCIVLSVSSIRHCSMGWQWNSSKYMYTVHWSHYRNIQLKANTKSTETSCKQPHRGRYMEIFATHQRRQSVLKSGGRGSSLRKFQFHRKTVSDFPKKLRFSTQKLLMTFHLSEKPSFTPTFLPNFSYFSGKWSLSTLHFFSPKYDIVFFQTRPQPPWPSFDPTTSLAQNMVGSRPPTTRIDAPASHFPHVYSINNSFQRAFSSIATVK